MSELSLSETQRRRLEAIREDLEAAYGGPYSTVRQEDAVEYLLETYTPPDALEGHKTEASETKANETATAEREPDDDLTDITGVGAATAEALAEAGIPSLDAVRSANPQELASVDGISAEQAADIKAEVEGFEDSGDAAVETDGDDDEDPGTPEDGDSPEDTLQQAMSLLDQHDGRWRESGGDEPYEVDLPDGSTEAVRTKDDIKRLLFKHWR